MLLRDNNADELRMLFVGIMHSCKAHKHAVPLLLQMHAVINDSMMHEQERCRGW